MNFTRMQYNMKNRSFVSSQHAGQYLTGSIIRYKEEPIYIADVSRDILFYCLNYEIDLGQASKQVGIKNKDIDMSAFNIGYVNIAKKLNSGCKAVRVFRKPLRHSRVGLDTSSFYSPDGAPNTTIYNIGFYNNVVNKFPKLSEIFNNKSSIIAFSKNFAVDTGSDKLYYLYADSDVGVMNKNDLYLKDEYIFLSELLEKNVREAA